MKNSVEHEKRTEHIELCQSSFFFFLVIYSVFKYISGSLLHDLGVEGVSL